MWFAYLLISFVFLDAVLASGEMTPVQINSLKNAGRRGLISVWCNCKNTLTNGDYAYLHLQMCRPSIAISEDDRLEYCSNIMHKAMNVTRRNGKSAIIPLVVLRNHSVVPCHQSNINMFTLDGVNQSPTPAETLRPMVYASTETALIEPDKSCQCGEVKCVDPDLNNDLQEDSECANWSYYLLVSLIALSAYALFVTVLLFCYLCWKCCSHSTQDQSGKPKKQKSSPRSNEGSTQQPNRVQFAEA